MASLKKSEQYRLAILNGNKAEASRLEKEIYDEIQGRYRNQPRQTQSMSSQSQQQQRPVSSVSPLGNDNIPCLRVYEYLNFRYGDQWWNWEIETLERRIFEDSGQVLSESNVDKIQALKTLCNNQMPFQDWFYFNQVAVAFAGAVADFQSMKYPSPGMVIAAIKIMKRVRPDEVFSDEVKKYCAIALQGEGIYVPPPTVFDILKESFDVSEQLKSKWPQILGRVGEMIETSDYENESDDAIDIQARRLINAENAADKYGG